MKAYDYLLTFSDELDYVWKQPTTPITLLFYFVRYMPIIDTTLLLARNSPSFVTYLNLSDLSFR